MGEPMRETRCECVQVFGVHADYCPASPNFSRAAKREMDAALRKYRSASTGDPTP